MPPVFHRSDMSVIARRRLYLFLQVWSLHAYITNVLIFYIRIIRIEVIRLSLYQPAQSRSVSFQGRACAGSSGAVRNILGTGYRVIKVIRISKAYSYFVVIGLVGIVPFPFYNKAFRRLAVRLIGGTCFSPEACGEFYFHAGACGHLVELLYQVNVFLLQPRSPPDVTCQQQQGDPRHRKCDIKRRARLLPEAFLLFRL